MKNQHPVTKEQIDIIAEGLVQKALALQKAEFLDAKARYEGDATMVYKLLKIGIKYGLTSAASAGLVLEDFKESHG